eukprot:scaffold10353_cov127-Isochrysis_galbana.AAC.4
MGGGRASLLAAGMRGQGAPKAGAPPCLYSRGKREKLSPWDSSHSHSVRFPMAIAFLTLLSLSPLLGCSKAKIDPC